MSHIPLDYKRLFWAAREVMDYTEQVERSSNIMTYQLIQPDVPVMDYNHAKEKLRDAREAYAELAAEIGDKTAETWAMAMLKKTYDL